MIACVLFAVAQTMTFTADRIAVDNVTQAAVATGHVVAVYKPYSLRSDLLTRDADGVMRFDSSTCATTCSNEVGHTHWNISGEIVYSQEEYVLLRDAWLKFFEIPIFYLPYLYYPLDSDCGFSWMPGYTGRWGAYVLTKYSYHLAGDRGRREDAYWLTGDTRLDLRYRQGVAVGEDLDWNLNRLGKGSFRSYYAWDQNVADSDIGMQMANGYWGRSQMDENRYGFEIAHRLEPTERDSVRMHAAVFSDSAFRGDFYRRSFFNTKSQFLGYNSSGVWWEHLENVFSVGAEASGRFNEFYGMTGRLPEVYVDVNPMPVFGLPINYETQNRIGYLNRDAADFGGNQNNVYNYNPAHWAEYEAFRFDTYHRLTAPFKVYELVAIAPRVGYHGTLWNRSGFDNLTGYGTAEEGGSMFRSIVEGGVTFSGRAQGMVTKEWRHMMEPYVDVLIQEASYSGGGNNGRPYVFDAIDASVMWEDQFAGRSRNLPYSYYGVTPGVRNAWEKMDERGHFQNVVDFDVYAAAQFNQASYVGTSEAHRLAEVGKPNYGDGSVYLSPGTRLRWTPDKDLTFVTRAEYDPDRCTLALGDVMMQHQVSKEFSWNLQYSIRDFRWYDYSSVPFDAGQMKSEDFNYARAHLVNVGFTQQPLDWFAWSPFLRWDVRDAELDSVGTWFDILTDCLGFRVIVEYENSFEYIDGYEHEEDWNIGFFVYLRAFGADAASVFMDR